MSTAKTKTFEMVWTSKHRTHGVVRVDRYDGEAPEQPWAIVELEDGKPSTYDDGDIADVVDWYDDQADAIADAETYDADRYYDDLVSHIEEGLADLDPNNTADRAKMDAIVQILGL